MEVSIQTVAFEFQSFGISLRNLLLRNNKRLIFSEQGLGGYRDGRISPDVPTLAKYPFLGEYLPLASMCLHRRTCACLLHTWCSQLN
jgi:hypothetical protein